MIKTLKQNRPLVLQGGLAGLLPFAVSALALQLGWAGTTPFLTYSVVILAFLSGVIWWHGLQKNDLPSIAAGLLTPALAWLLLFLSPGTAVGLLGAAFLLLWCWEMVFLRSTYSAGYRLLRTTLTFCVLLLHGWVWLIL